MGFGYHIFDKGAVPPIEYHDGKAGEVFAVGEVLVVGGDGTLTKCGATAVPSHLCVGPRMGNGTVPVTRVSHDIEYTAVLTVDGTALKAGDKVTLSADGMGLTATTTGGVAQIVRLRGKAAGDTVDVRFAV